MITVRYRCCRHCNGHGLYIDWDTHLVPCRAYWGCDEGRKPIVTVERAA